MLDHIKPHPELVIACGGQLAWVMRNNNPHLKQLVDEFVESRAAGTSFGNTLLRRCLQNTKWVKKSTSEEEMKKFQIKVALFQKYATEYNFDYLMLAAQGYQESMLDQSKRNPSGVVEIMQVIAHNAVASPINIPDVENIDGNIHAGAKMLCNIADTHFKEPEIDPITKTLFVFASYMPDPIALGGCANRQQIWGLTRMSGSAMWKWLRPKILDKRPSHMSAISTSTTSLTTWRSDSRSSGTR